MSSSARCTLLPLELPSSLVSVVAMAAVTVTQPLLAWSWSCRSALDDTHDWVARAQQKELCCLWDVSPWLVFPQQPHCCRHKLPVCCCRGDVCRQPPPAPALTSHATNAPLRHRPMLVAVTSQLHHRVLPASFRAATIPDRCISSSCNHPNPAHLQTSRHSLARWMRLLPSIGCRATVAPVNRCHLCRLTASAVAVSPVCACLGCLSCIPMQLAC